MEYTKNKIPEDVQKVINNYKEYIDTKIYYYGSVQRADYFIGQSDIDILVFTDNVETMIHKTSHYFHLNKKKFRKIIWNHKNKLIEGVKVVYRSNDPKFTLEISIYDEKYKEYILDNISKDCSFFVSILLIVLKCLYYNFQILPLSYYIYYKRIIFNYIKGENTIFIKIN